MIGDLEHQKQKSLGTNHSAKAIFTKFCMMSFIADGFTRVTDKKSKEIINP